MLSACVAFLFLSNPQDPAAGKAAQEPAKKEAPQEQAKKPAIPSDRRAGKRLELSLRDCLGLGSEKNVDLRVSRLLEAMAHEDEGIASAVFEPEFFLTGSWSRTESPRRSQIQPSVTSKIYNVTAGLRSRIWTGASLELAFSPSYFEQEVASQFAFPTNAFAGGLNVSVDQPLLRGAWPDYWQADVDRALREKDARREDRRRNEQEILDSIVSAYFDLVFTREDYRVILESLEVAREQLRNTEKRIELGELAQRDKVADEAEVARREESLITAENAILDAEDALKRLILPFQAVEDWEIAIIPVAELGPNDPPLRLPDFQSAMRVAEQNRPDLEAKRLRVDQARLNLGKAERDLLPGLDLSASYDADAQRDSFGDLQKDIFQSRFPDYSLSLSLSLPLGNLAARSKFRKATLELERQRRELMILILDVQADLRATLRNVETLAKTIAASRESVRLAVSNLDTEKIKLSLDSTTQFEVQRRSQELSDARSRLIRARLNYRVSLYHLMAVQGRLNARSSLGSEERK
ncbi:MAG: TolC family protein [Planctomycetota bacterium]